MIFPYEFAAYGTGAIMAVPCGDQRDFNFAQHFNIPITNIIGSYFNGREANPARPPISIAAILAFRAARRPSRRSDMILFDPIVLILF